MIGLRIDIKGGHDRILRQTRVQLRFPVKLCDRAGKVKETDKLVATYRVNVLHGVTPPFDPGYDPSRHFAGRPHPFGTNAHLRRPRKSLRADHLVHGGADVQPFDNPGLFGIFAGGDLHDLSGSVGVRPRTHFNDTLKFSARDVDLGDDLLHGIAESGRTVLTGLWLIVQGQGAPKR